MIKLAQLDVLSMVSLMPELNVVLMAGVGIVFLLLLRRRRCD